MPKDPAFLFYHHDFLIGTEFLSAEETGLYIRILCHLADKGRLSLEHMKSICKGYDFSANLKDKFLMDDEGFYYNERLRKEVEKRRLHSEHQRNNANMRWHSSGIAMAMPLENRNRNRNDISNKGVVKGVPDFLETLKTNLAYKHINLEVELARMDAWLLAHKGRLKTKRFIINWLNRIEVPIKPQTKTVIKIAAHVVPDPKERSKVADLIHQTTTKIGVK